MSVSRSLRRGPFVKLLHHVSMLWIMWYLLIVYAVAPAGYVRTGALFFRDRFYHRNEAKKKSIDYAALNKFFVDNGVDVTEPHASELYERDGVSLYWRYGVHGTDASGHSSGRPVLVDFQDSSVVVLNKGKHQQLLSVMEKLLGSLDLGSADKEAFWVLATISLESFSFSPFLAGQYGDCSGVIVHFDPSDELMGRDALPVYINAEGLLGQDVQEVGEGLSMRMTSPKLVSSLSRGEEVEDYESWGKASGSTGCTCSVYECREVPVSVSQQLLLYRYTQLL